MADWSTAVPDWEDRILSGRSLVPTLPLNRAEADRALRVFKRLKAPDIVGKPTMAEVAGGWFLEIVEVIFGAYFPTAGVRRISEVFVLVPKKNGKSSYSGSLALTTLIVNRRPAAEFLFVAPTKTIANIAFRQAELTVKADPALAALFHVQTHIRRITHRNTDAIAEIKAADTDAITGGKNTYTLIDETHEFAAKPRADQVFVEVRGALAARPDGFLIQLTTQSKAPPAGVFKAELEVARAVRDGELKSRCCRSFTSCRRAPAPTAAGRTGACGRWSTRISAARSRRRSSRTNWSPPSAPAPRRWRSWPRSISTSRSGFRCAPTAGPARTIG